MLKNLLKQLIILLPLYSLLRIWFLCFNQALFDQSDPQEIILSFIYGLRFDLAAICLINLPFIILSLLPLNSAVFFKLKKIVFILMNSIAVVCLFGDVEYFKFTGKRLTSDLFYIAGDLQNQSGQIIFNYWYHVLAIILCIFYLFKVYPKQQQVQIYFKYYFLKAIGVLVICFILIRGGLQSRSIGAKDAFIFQDRELGNLVLNPVYTLMRSAFKPAQKPIKLEDPKEIDSTIATYIPQVFSSPTHNKNVVIIILESFSWEYIEDGYTPFLASLKDYSLFFKGYAGGRRSIEALPSILVGIPSLTSTPLSQSSFQGNELRSFPYYLPQYDTSFYHGGKNGTMGFDTFTRALGFKDYFGKDEYPFANHFDGNWGIFDHYYLDYFKKELDQKKAPFLSVVFTLSSHQPYTIPKGFEAKYPKGELPIHETIGYVDDALKTFFSKAQSSPWFKDTLFVITADHTQELMDGSGLKKYQVPIIFYDPARSFSVNRETVSQVDILPSVLDYLGRRAQKTARFGNSVFSNAQGEFFVIKNGLYYSTSKSEKLKRSLHQYGINNLIRNSLYK